MPIQYTVLGFDLTTIMTLVSSHNHLTKRFQSYNVTFRAAQKL